MAYTEDGQLSPAGLGFLKKNGLTEKDVFIENDYIHAKIKIEGKKTADLLKDNVPALVLKLQGPHRSYLKFLDVGFRHLEEF